MMPAGCREGAKPPAAPLQRVTIAYTALPNSCLLAIAWKKGYFAEEGLDAVPQVHSFGKLAMETLIAGKADFAASADIPIMFAIMKGEKISPVAVIQTSNRNEAIFARKDKGVSTPSDLKGRRIGMTPGTTSEFFLDSFLMAQMIGEHDVVAVPLKPEQMLPALQAGTVDAVSTWHPYLFQMQKAFGAAGVSFNDAKIYTEIFCLSTHGDYAARNPQIVKKLLRALLKAENFMAQHPDLSVELAADFLTLDRGLLTSIWKDFDYHVTLGQDLLLTLENQSRWAIKSGLTPAAAVPNYLRQIYLDGLLAVKPEAVTILH
jgi:NitT/TauT family transport system substrate-binding protein